MGYLNLVHNNHLVALYEQHCVALGLEFADETDIKGQTASGDIGNVSQVVPTIEPGYSIHTTSGNHTRDFAVAAGILELSKYFRTSSHLYIFFLQLFRHKSHWSIFIKIVHLLEGIQKRIIGTVKNVKLPRQ